MASAAMTATIGVPTRPDRAAGARGVQDACCGLCRIAPVAGHHQAEPARIGMFRIDRRRQPPADDRLDAVGQRDHLVEIL